MSGELTLPLEALERAGEAAPADHRGIERARVRVAGRWLETTPVFDTYWRFASRRQSIYLARTVGDPGPWTGDPVLATHRFTNCYRAADRVSQYLIQNVIYRGGQDPQEVVFRTLLFKFFNKVATWEELTRQLGEISWATWELGAYDEILTAAASRGQRIYSAAYVIPPPRLGAVRKHTNHLRLLDLMMGTGIVDSLVETAALGEVFDVLSGYPSLGSFLAFQFAIDLNYSTVVDFDEMDHVVAGPGARDGIRKCFGAASTGVEQEVIRYMAETQDEHFARLGLPFGGLNGRPLQLIDCQNLFCEVDKYARVAHPDIAGISGRSRIKQRFCATATPVTAWFPPKWGINRDTDREVPQKESACSM